MTLFDYEELCRYWAKNPPVHLMVAAYLGVGKTSSEAQSAKDQQKAISEILAGGGTAVVNKRVFERGMPKMTFDATELFARRPPPRSAAQRA